MASTPRTISQRISLEGAEQIRQLLTQIGQVGEKAFAQISAATSSATKGLEGVSKAVAAVEVEITKVADAGRNFGSALNNLGGAANRFGSALSGMTTRIAAIGAAAAAAGVALTAFGVNGVNAVDDLGETATALGLSVDAYQKLQFAAAQAGVSQEKFATGMAKLSKQIEDAAQKEAKALLDFAESARKNLNEPGVHVVDMSRDFTREFQVINEAARKLQDQLKSRGIEIPLFRIRDELKKLADGTAEARQKFQELTGQALGDTTKGLEQLRLQAETSDNALRKLGVQIARNADGSINYEETIGRISDAFEKLPEGTQRTTAAIEIFGKSGAKLGAFFAQGRAALQDTIKELERLGILLTKDEVEAADKAANALDLLSLAATNLKNRLGVIFAGPIREGASALTRLIAQNQAGLQRFARDVEARVTPILRDFIRLLSGQESEIENQGILRARDAVVEFGTAVRDAFSNIIVPAFRTLLGILDRVAQGINAVFGTNLTGGQVGIAIVVAQLIGAFTTFAAIVGVVVAGIKILSTTFTLLFTTGAAIVRILITLGAVLAGLVGWPALIVVSLIAAAAAIVVFWEKIKAGAAVVWEAIKAGALAAWTFVKDTFSKPFEGAWKWIVETFDAAVATVKTKANELLEFLKKKFTGSPIQGGNTAPEIPQPQSAPGGVSPLGNLVQPASLTGAGQASAQQVAALRQQFATVTTELETLATTALQIIKSLVNEAGTSITLALQSVTDGVQATIDGITASVQVGGELIVTIISSAIQRATTAAQAMVNALSGAVGAIFAQMQASLVAFGATINGVVQSLLTNLDAAVAKAQALAQAAQAAAAAAASAGAGGRGGGGGNTPLLLAGGGAVHGPGSATSDSIWARLSDGEFVQRAAAVRYYGASFMAALNSMRIPRDAFRGFHLGGMVDGFNRSMASLAVPRFAMGGLNDLAPAMAGGRHFGTLDLALPGGGTATVWTDEAVAESLFRVAKRSANNLATKKTF